jgi:hypothetical protein
MKNVCLAIPTYDHTMHTLCMTSALTASKRHAINTIVHNCSLLAHGFNAMWAHAILDGADYLAMLHSDIGAPPNWVDTLIDILNDEEADIVSALSPIKGPDNDYSTALLDRINPWAEPRKVTFADLAGLGETFDGPDLAAALNATGILGINTGCWVAKIGNRTWPRRVHFEIRSRINWSHDPPRCEVIPEDWNLSRQAYVLGLRVVCTTAITIKHAGNHVWQSLPAGGVLRHGRQPAEPIPSP